MEGVVRAALAKLRVIQVKGRYKHWALALRSLAYPTSTPRRNAGLDTMEEQAPSLVCMDGLSKCHWTEKWVDEERSSSSTSAHASTGRSARPNACPPGVTPTDAVGMREVMQAVGKLRLDMGCVVICTVQGLWVRLRYLFSP